MLDKEFERKEVEVTRQLESASIAVSTYRRKLNPITKHSFSIEEAQEKFSHLRIHRSSFSASMRGAKIFVFRI